MQNKGKPPQDFEVADERVDRKGDAQPPFAVGPNGLVGGAHFTAKPFLEALFGLKSPKINKSVRLHTIDGELWSSAQVLECLKQAIVTGQTLADAHEYAL